MLAFWLRGLILGFSAAAQPGPFQAYLLAQTLKNGWQRTLPAAFAPLISDGPIVALVLLILTQTSDWFLNLLQIAGGLFLLYLGREAYVAFKRVDSALLPPAESVQRGLFKAALMNALSPNPYIFWATIAGPILIEGWRQSPGSGLSFVTGFYATLIGGFIGFIALFATAKRLDPQVNRIMSALSALALLLFGVYQLWLGILALVRS